MCKLATDYHIQYIQCSIYYIFSSIATMLYAFISFLFFYFGNGFYLNGSAEVSLVWPQKFYHLWTIFRSIAVLSEHERSPSLCVCNVYKTGKYIMKICFQQIVWTHHSHTWNKLLSIKFEQFVWSNTQTKQQPTTNCGECVENNIQLFAQSKNHDRQQPTMIEYTTTTQHQRLTSATIYSR